MKTIHLSLLLWLCVCGIVSSACGQTFNEAESRYRGIRVRNPDNGTVSMMRLQQLEITVEIIGNIATTKMDMTFHNDLPRLLEGELSFPLGEGQTVSAFAMELNGALRQGVVVEKQKGQQVFESVARRKVDPALLEWTPGNNFKARIYPIPANGDKRIVISYEQELTYAEDVYIYKLPLEYGMQVEKFNLQFHIINQPDVPLAIGSDFSDMKFSKDGADWIATITKGNYLPPQTLEVKIPYKKAETIVFVDQGYVDDANFFYINSFHNERPQSKEMPKSLCVFWDASASGTKRNTTKEMDLLLAYLDRMEKVEVTFITFSNEIDQTKTFSIQNCNNELLKQYIENITYDGGTQLGVLDFTKYSCDEILLFSDGVSNFGKHEIRLSSTPVMAINSSTTANHDYLNFVARNTTGNYFNLEKIEIAQVVELLSGQNLRFLSAVYDTDAISSVYPSLPQLCQGTLTFAGRLLTDSARLELNFGYGNNISFKEVYIIRSQQASSTGMIERIWVQKKIQQLQSDFKKHDEEITALGKKYSIVTRNTSLIVLELLSDYVRYEILPPPEMQAEYLTQMKAKTKVIEQSKDAHIENIIQQYSEKQQWWETEVKPKMTGIFSNSDTTIIPEIPTDADAAVSSVDYSVSADEVEVAPEPLIEEQVTAQSSTPQASHDTRTQNSQNTEGILSGLVVDADSKEPIPFANVFCPATHTGTTTDFDGKFSLSVPTGSIMTVTYVGYQPISFNAGNLGSVEISMNGANVQLSTFEITDYKVPLIDKDATSSVYVTSEEISKQASRNIVDLITTVGGVYSQDGSNEISIRGARTDANALYIDGIRVHSNPRLPIGSVEEITVYTGGIPAKYGDLTGGVIDITTTSFSHAQYYQEYYFSSSNETSEYVKPSIPPWRKALIKSRNLYQTYLQIKSEYADYPAFYREVSDMLIADNQKKLGVKVLSNLAELELQNHELMRILARRLEQINENVYAIDQFKDILKLRPEEPHSYRDLGLAYAENGQYQESVDMLQQVLLKDWDSRFPNIASIVLGELNSIISLAGNKIDTSTIDRRLRINLPVDVRIVLNWDADNTDMDLWVTEPGGEKCFYGHQRTAAGGYLSKDFTRGYGPEEYMIKKAQQGTYTIQLNYFSNSRTDTKNAVTLQVQIFTNYGRPEQTKKEITLMLTDNKQVIDVGTLVYDAKQK